nr:hypothetical protein [Tanacetum cinerariifolium]
MCKIAHTNANVNNTNNINTVSPTDNAVSLKDNDVDENIVYGCADDPNMPNLEEIVFSDEDVGAEVDMTNLDTNNPVSPILTTRIHKDHPVEQIIGDIHSAPQTRRMTKNVTNYEPKKGYTQEEEIDYDEMDVKSAFLYGKIEEEVYVCQPLGYEDLELPNRVYKVEKASYGLHQAPRAWKEMFTEFEKMMHKKFQMSYMGELTFFLGLQVTQKDDGIFISQYKYVDEILKKFSFSTVKTTSMPIETSKPLMKDGYAEDVDVYLYRSMTGSLMYLTSSRPDIMFDICACARFQVTPKVSHLYDVKRIFRYLKGQPKLGLWYPKDSPFTLETYIDNDYAGASLDRKSTTGEKSAENADFAKIVDFLNVNPIRKTKRNATEISQSSGPTTIVADETVYEERGYRVERTVTTAASLDAEPDSGTIDRTQSTTIPNEPIPQGTGLGFRNYSSKEESQEVGKEEKVKNSTTHEEIQRRYGRDTKINTASTSITTTSINITTAKPVTTVSAPVTTAGVSVSTAEPSTPPTTTVNEDEDLTIAQIPYENEKG